MSAASSIKDKFFLRAAYQISRSARGRKLLSLVSGSTLVQRVTMGGPNPVHLWDEDLEFAAVGELAARLSVSSRRAQFNLYQLARNLGSVRGDLAEVGVYRGGTATLLARMFEGTNRQLFLFDTFEGMPALTDPALDRFRAGDFADTSLDSVKRLLSPWPNIQLVQGVFPDSAAVAESRRFALVHIDVDIRQSVHDCCEFFYPRLATGGAIVFDDYGFLSCPGARQAVNEFFAEKPEHPLYLESGQAVVWRAG